MSSWLSVVKENFGFVGANRSSLTKARHIATVLQKQINFGLHTYPRIIRNIDSIQKDDKVCLQLSRIRCFRHKCRVYMRSLDLMQLWAPHLTQLCTAWCWLENELPVHYMLIRKPPLQNISNSWVLWVLIKMLSRQPLVITWGVELGVDEYLLHGGYVVGCTLYISAAPANI